MRAPPLPLRGESLGIASERLADGGLGETGNSDEVGPDHHSTAGWSLAVATARSIAVVPARVASSVTVTRGGRRGGDDRPWCRQVQQPCSNAGSVDDRISGCSGLG